MRACAHTHTYIKNSLGINNQNISYNGIESKCILSIKVRISKVNNYFTNQFQAGKTPMAHSMRRKEKKEEKKQRRKEGREGGKAGVAGEKENEKKISF